MIRGLRGPNITRRRNAVQHFLITILCASLDTDNIDSYSLLEPIYLSYVDRFSKTQDLPKYSNQHPENDSEKVSVDM